VRKAAIALALALGPILIAQQARASSTYSFTIIAGPGATPNGINNAGEIPVLKCERLELRDAGIKRHVWTAPRGKENRRERHPVR
jgi:hypothetical protein